MFGDVPPNQRVIAVDGEPHVVVPLPAFVHGHPLPVAVVRTAARTLARLAASLAASHSVAGVADVGLIPKVLCSDARMA